MLTDLRKNLDLLVVVALAIIAYHFWVKRHGHIRSLKSAA